MNLDWFPWKKLQQESFSLLVVLTIQVWLWFNINQASYGIVIDTISKIVNVISVIALFSFADKLQSFMYSTIFGGFKLDNIQIPPYLITLQYIYISITFVVANLGMLYLWYSGFYRRHFGMHDFDFIMQYFYVIIFMALSIRAMRRSPEENEVI